MSDKAPIELHFTIRELCHVIGDLTMVSHTWPNEIDRFKDASKSVQRAADHIQVVYAALEQAKESQS